LNKESEIYKLQSRLYRSFFQHIPLPDNVYGFIKGGAYKDFLMPHIKMGESTRYYIRMDIKSFFDSIDTSLLKDVLAHYFKINDEAINNSLLTTTIELVTLKGILPQGAVTSPVVSNIVFRQLDLRIRKYCRKLKINYSRYADDMLFSSESKFVFEDFFIKKISWILKSKDFKLNFSKIKKGLNEISLNGFVVGDNIRISRKKRHDISTILYLYEEGGKPQSIQTYINRLNNASLLYRIDVFSDKSQVINYLCGYRSYLLDWLQQDDLAHHKLIKRVEELIINVDKLK
jgi:RNA-directed DNA polymerase